MEQRKLLKKMRWQLFLLGRLKIPMVGFTRVRLLDVTDEEAIVRIKLRRRTRNHLNSMYFGALAVGADVAGGIHAFYFAMKHEQRVSFAFKGMNASFLKRVESDCTFKCHDGQKVEEAIKSSMEKGERVNETTEVNAYNDLGELVATFEMIVSVKCSKP